MFPWNLKNPTLEDFYMASVALLQFQLFAAEDITCNVLVNILSFVRFGMHLIIYELMPVFINFIVKWCGSMDFLRLR